MEETYQQTYTVQHNAPTVDINFVLHQSDISIVINIVYYKN